MLGQLTIGDYLKSLEPQPKDSPKFKAGDVVGVRTLGDVDLYTIRAVEGSPGYWLYRTDFHYIDSAKASFDIDRLRREAAEVRKEYETIEISPYDLTERVTIAYAPRVYDGCIMHAQIGIYGNMLFWKEDCTYQFLEPHKTKQSLKNAYKRHYKKMTEDWQEFNMVDEPIPIKRLYWSRKGFYTDARYVEFNG